LKPDAKPDDNEPVTAAWLLAAGWLPVAGEPFSFTSACGFLRLDLFGHDDSRCVDAVIGGVIFPHYETRGLVRGLCAALRVDLVEPDGTATAGERASAA
jgi:hypothetical protein